MLKDPDFYTVTMARVYEDQGLWEKAAEIYHSLLKQEPERKDLADALSHVENKMRAGSNKKPDELIPLFREWINLLLHAGRLRRLKKLKGRLSG
jgi:hypothetical protein